MLEKLCFFSSLFKSDLEIVSYQKSNTYILTVLKNAQRVYHVNFLITYDRKKGVLLFKDLSGNYYFLESGVFHNGMCCLVN